MGNSSKFKGKKHGIKRLKNALSYSLDGLKSAFDEAGFRELCLLHGALLTILFFANFSLGIKLILILASGISIICELFNSAIEAAIDFTSLEIHPLAKRAKDIASAAQYISLLLVIILWLVVIIN